MEEKDKDMEQPLKGQEQNGLIVENKLKPKKEKQRLIKVLERIKSDLEKEDNEVIRDTYLSYSEEVLNIELKVKKPSIMLKLFYWFVLMLITSIYLVGSFIIASLKRSSWNLFNSSIECFFNIFCDREEFKKQTNFFEYFLDQLLKEPMDLNLIMFWNFLGIKLSNSIGFIFTSLIFLGLNILILVLTYNIDYELSDQETDNYSFIKIILLFFNWGFMAIFFGGSTLILSQQNKNEKQKDPKEKIKEQNEKYRKKNLKALFLFALANFLGFSGKYGIAIAFTKYKQDNIIILRNETIDNNTLDNFFYFNNNYTDIPDKIDDDDDIISYNNNLYQKIFLYIHLVYFGCILISVSFYILLKCCYFQINCKEKTETINKNKFGCCSCLCCNCCLCCDCCKYGCCTCECCKCNICLWKTIFEMSGCILYSERVNLLEEEEKEKTPGCCCQLCCNSIGYYFNNAICNMCNCRKNPNDDSCCCCKYEEIEFDKDRQCFCYCYQENSLCYWINKYFVNDTQKTIISCMILYFIGRLSTIGCQEEYEAILRKENILNDTKAFFVSLGGLFAFFTVILYVIILLKICLEENICLIFSDNELISNDFVFLLIKNVDPNLVGIIFLLYIDIVGGLEYASEILFFGFDYMPNPFEYDEAYIEKVHLYFSIFVNVYFVFILNYYCTIIAKKKIDSELLPQTILVSIYLIICDSLVSGIKLIVGIHNLYILQLVITIITGLISTIILFRTIIVFFILLSNEICHCNFACNSLCCVLCCAKINKFFFDFELKNKGIS